MLLLYLQCIRQFCHTFFEYTGRTAHGAAIVIMGFLKSSSCKRATCYPNSTTTHASQRTKGANCSVYRVNLEQFFSLQYLLHNRHIAHGCFICVISIVCLNLSLLSTRCWTTSGGLPARCSEVGSCAGHFDIGIWST